MRSTTHASLALFLLSLFALSATPNPVEAQTVQFLITSDRSLGIGFQFKQVSNPIFGTLPSGSLTGEIVVSTQELGEFETINLPIYPSDGMLAQEDEIFWTVGMKEQIHYLDPSSTFSATQTFVNFIGRTLTASAVGSSNDVLRFNVTVVAVRKAAPVAVEETSIGEVKTKFKE